MLDKPISQLILERPARSRVFERYGLNYCCAGKQPLRESCTKRGVDPEAVVRDLRASDLGRKLTPLQDAHTLAEVCDYIEAVHHAYLREALPRLSYLTRRVADRHGDRDARLGRVADLFDTFRADLEAHMDKEEMVLFPICRQLDTATDLPRFPFQTVANPIRQMIAEHAHADSELAEMALLTNGFRAVGEECNTHRAMLQALEELAADMQVHVELEDKRLFPAAIAREEALTEGKMPT